jgi:hypothetical protein
MVKSQHTARFIEPLERLPVEKILEGDLSQLVDKSTVFKIGSPRLLQCVRLPLVT